MGKIEFETLLTIDRSDFCYLIRCSVAGVAPDTADEFPRMS